MQQTQTQLRNSYVDYCLGKYIDELKPKESFNDITRGLHWDVLEYNNIPIGIIGYYYKQQGEALDMYISLIYIDKKYRLKPTLWLESIKNIALKKKIRYLEIQALPRLKRLLEHYLGVTPELLIYKINVQLQIFTLILNKKF